ncbi:MAG: glycoside hydrolase family 3 protein [Bacilli bacterium]|nr:glycoside hydrolase family 3 protein [Bacilli bacterium]
MNKETLEKLTLREKASILVGHKTMSTYPIPKKGVEPIIMSDGPNGLRLENPDGDSLTGVSDSLPTTCFPVGVTLASTWNKNLAYHMGEAIGEEAVNFGVDLLLGPAVNIQRNPLCGRNFEYLSEDPLLSGTIGAGYVSGLQSKGLGACVKHFACNSNEKYRFVGDSIVDERALHEIYLKPFEIIAKQASPRAFMTAYNQVNGSYCSENSYLIEKTLRGQWGFDGVVLTDWGGMVHRDIALNAGCDLEMPGMVEHNINSIVMAVKEGRVQEETLDRSVLRLLELKKRCRQEKKPCDFSLHYQKALDIALEGAVLLKNENGILPLKKEKKHLVIGGLFATMRYQGSGSSLLNPIQIKTHQTAWQEMGIDYEFVQGYDEAETAPDQAMERKALAKAIEYGQAVFFGGLSDYLESEGFDREDMKLPANQLSLLERLVNVGVKIVLVLFGGSPVELQIEGGIAAILDMMLPGEAGGEATAKLLFGDVSPSGKLSQSWPMSYEDVPFGKEFAANPYEPYKESVFVGYRYYATVEKAVRYPFGYGMSYSSFTYKDLLVECKGECIEVSFSLQNNGVVDAKEIAEVYVGKKDSHIVRPKLELKGFTKIALAAMERQRVAISIPKKNLSVFIDGAFRLEEGAYEIYVGPSSDCLPLQGEVVLSGEALLEQDYDREYRSFLQYGTMEQATFERLIGRAIPTYAFDKKPYTLETPIGEFSTFFGKIFKSAVCGVGLRQFKKAKKIKDPLLREREKKAGWFVYKLMPYNSLRSLSFSSSGAFPYPIALGILELSNGHFLRGIKAMLRKEKKKE